MKKTQTLHFKKHTKGTTVFEASASEDNPVIRSLYVSKPHFAASQQINLTIQDEAEEAL